MTATAPGRDAAVFQGRVVPGDRPGNGPERPQDERLKAERPRPARVAVVGAGAVGTYLAARASEAGAQVVLCARRGGFERVQVVSAPGGPATERPMRVITDPAELGQTVDWVVVATKAHQTPAALGWLHAALEHRRDVGVVVAQNGVRQADQVSPPVPHDSVLPAVVYINAELAGPGVVRHLAYGVLQVPDCALGERFARVLPVGDVRLVDDVVTAAWSKLLSNSAANSLTALTSRGLEVMRRPDVGALALAVMRETAAVGRADGARLPADAPERTLDRICNQPAGAGTSMLRDRLAGRPLEHEALIGAVVRIGEQVGVATPTCSALLPLLAAINVAASPAG
ncbi:2-dehydropantoate 2-reductase [Parafrankia irregularis]|uniref:2-dehydropantoate 2-reductase n=1 Tax=Parafrankia irregularis TaxID=795642 RepID=A0A0S4QDU7_9ACTN|nr:MULTISPECIES: 2-dehydropantoate 2-reductase [Parafrankia]MBE3199593.1 2-dehydropantoate 2-reductase [Parafrankia sp. CH37]CUU53739.1 2-dehydropantoate 2-reductase [Parafrankia irregularis]